MNSPRFESASLRFNADDWIGNKITYDIFHDAADQHGDQIAFRHLQSGEPDEKPRLVSYRDMHANIARTANLLRDMGATPGTAVGLMLPGLPETQWLIWGAETAAAAFPINFLLSAEHIATLLAVANCSVLAALGPLAGTDIWSKALAVRKMMGGDAPALLQVGGIADAASGARLFGEALGVFPDSLDFVPPHDGAAATAAFFHTGGTTGAPKLVRHTHRNQLAAAFGFAYAADLAPGDVLTNGFPLFHVAGTICCSLAPFMTGATVLNLTPAGFRNPRMISDYWRLIERHKVTVAGGVPTALAAVAQVPVDGADLSSLRCGYTGGSLTPRSAALAFEAATGRRLHEVYGMTETAGVIAVERCAGSHEIGTVGHPAPFVECRVLRLDPDGSPGANCADGESGVLVVRGETVTPGYRDPQHDRSAFTVDGWLITGDLAVMAPDGRLTITGRSKDLIIRSGHNIDPAMIEEAALSFPGVTAAAAVGQPDRYAGELPVLYVAGMPGAAPNVDALKAHVAASVAERPAAPKQVFLVNELPLTAIGKIYKPALRADAARRMVVVMLEEFAVEHPALPGLVVCADEKPGGRISIVLQPNSDALIPADMLKALAGRLDGFLFEWSLDPLAHGHAQAAANAG